VKTQGPEITEAPAVSLKTITLRDIAQRAGVSINTVSRALNNKADVSVSTRSRVLRLARQFGYTPNGVAQGLRAKRTGTIGVVVADIANPFFAAVVKGIEVVTRSAGYSIILCNTDEEYPREQDAVDVMLRKRVDGMLLVPCQTDRGTVTLLGERHVPFVLVGRRFDDLPTAYVVNDDAQGGFLATDYLIGRGHQRILFVNGPSEIWSAQQRRVGYLRALAAHQIPSDPALIRTTTAMMDGGRRAMTDALRENLRFTAVYAYSDLLACGVLKALREHDRRVPQDIAVVGHDNIEFVEMAEPPLTTVDLPKTRLGRAAARILIAQLHHDVSVKQQVVLAPRLIVRGSA
jgi:LacI family transcriptional regulator